MLNDYSVGDAAGSEEALPVIRGGVGTCVVGYTGTVAGREKIGQPLLINCPDKSDRGIEIAAGGQARVKNPDIGIFADVKQVHGVSLLVMQNVVF